MIKKYKKYIVQAIKLTFLPLSFSALIIFTLNNLLSNQTTVNTTKDKKSSDITQTKTVAQVAKNSIKKIKYNNKITFPSKVTIPLIGKITTYFGYRIHPITKKIDFHPAIDISGTNNSDIKSILSGQVNEIGESDIYGNYIIIQHRDGIRSKYCHCQKIYKNPGNKIEQGEVIASVGHSGLATGDHLHLEIEINDIKVDPLILIDKKIDEK